VFTLGSLLVWWLLLVAAGFQGPMSLFTSVLAVPPIGTLADAFISGSTFPGKTSLWAVLVVIAVHALFLATVTAMSIEALTEGSVTTGVVRRALKALPTTLAVGFICAFGLLAGQLALAIIGPGIGLALLILGFIIGVSWLGFAPAAVLAQNTPSVYAMGISMRAARIPGTNSLALAALYTFGSLAVLIGAARPLGLLDVNPGAAQWIFVMLANLLHVVFVATLAYRYLAVAPEVPPPAPRRR